METANRQLDLILLGATGYTGKLCAEHITKNLPTNLKWAISGRSADKLNALSEQMQKKAPDRKPPEILPVQLNDAELSSLAIQAKVLINCIGPYHLYSSPVVAACVNSGTHYLDVTGEVPWVKEMIDKHHETAKAQGTILVSAAGMDSVPTDLLTWVLANSVKENYAVPAKEAIVSGYDLRFAGISGGTFATLLEMPSNFPMKELKAAQNPHYLAASRPTATKSTPLLQRLLGVRSFPHIGTVTSSVAASLDTPIVQRTGSLMPELFDRDFRFREYMNTSGWFKGLITHFALTGMFVLLALPPVRWLMKKWGPSVGTGPSKESSAGKRIEFRGIGTGEKDGKSVQVLGRFAYEGDAYMLTGVTVTEAAMVLLDEKKVKELGGGFLTPGMLGHELVDRLQKAGLAIEANRIE